MDKLNSDIEDLFEKLNEFLEKKEKSRKIADYNMKRDRYDYASMDGQSYILVPVDSSFDGKLRVVPFANPSELPFFNGKFEKYTEPRKRFNAYAYVFAGNAYDKFSKQNYDEREKFVEKTLVPLIEKDLNEFFKTQKLDGRPLKAKIVNGKFTLSQQIDKELPRQFDGVSYSPYCVKLAIKVSFA